MTRVLLLLRKDLLVLRRSKALLAILWSSLFERLAPLDVRELMRAHVELLFGTRDAP